MRHLGLLAGIVGAACFALLFYFQERNQAAKIESLHGELTAVQQQLMELTSAINSQQGASAFLARAMQQSPCPQQQIIAAPTTSAELAKDALPPSPEQISALNQMQDVLQSALRSGHWRKEDTLAIRAHEAELSPQQQEDLQELRRKIADAINRGQLVPDSPRFMLP